MIPRERIETFLLDAAKARSVVIHETRLMSGGAVRENWFLRAEIHGGDFEGVQNLVLRTNAATALGIGLDRVQEFNVLRAVHAAGIRAPEPLFLCTDGNPFFLMRAMPGIALGREVVAMGNDEERAALAASLGRELARIHHFTPAAPSFLGPQAQGRLEDHARFLRESDEPHPVGEWAVRWLLRNAPAPLPQVLCHGDFRTGNYLVEAGRLTAVLDWDFAGWGDPDEDIAWFCSRLWRFGADRCEAGGIAALEVFYEAYEAESGRRIEPSRVHYWEVMAALRYLIIALRMRDRLLVGGERSLQLALIGRRPAEAELEILRLIDLVEAA